MAYTSLFRTSNGLNTVFPALLKLVGGIHSSIIIPAPRASPTSLSCHSKVPFDLRIPPSLDMAPIASPKLLAQILMHGYASVLADPKQFPLPIVRPTLMVDHRKAIAAVLSPQTVISTSSTKMAYALLPNCTFIRKHEEVDRNSLVSGSLSEVRTTTPSATSTISTSTSSSARSSTSIDSPSSDATSLPPWCLVPRASDDAIVKFRAPQARVPRYIRTRPPPVDSLRITRMRRENEAANLSSGSMFISRPLKKSRATGLKGFGLRIIKRVKQW
ncbi:hypothetical protein FRC08_014860 [Ceratobasidium sp. 394]|nr:hypothetical protein FRC08_014860 [Ceratobasidium sp. 394]